MNRLLQIVQVPACIRNAYYDMICIARVVQHVDQYMIQRKPQFRHLAANSWLMRSLILCHELLSHFDSCSCLPDLRHAPFINQLPQG